MCGRITWDPPQCVQEAVSPSWVNYYSRRQGGLRLTVAVRWQVRDPLWAQGGLMKVSEGGQLLERLEIEAQGALPLGAVATLPGLTSAVESVVDFEADEC